MHSRRSTLFLITLTLSTLLHAASFNCSQAHNLREKTVCANPELSKLDDQLAAAYKSSREGLSPEAVDAIQNDQREWLHWLDDVCPATTPATNDPAICLTNHYDERLTQLTTDRLNADGIRFYARAHYVFVRGKPEAGQDRSASDPGFGYGEFSWPQIDNPDPAQRAFNKAIYAATLESACCMGEQRKIATLDDAVDSTSYVYGFYTLFSANSRLIDVGIGNSFYSGGAHPNGGVTTFAWWLDAQRPLTVDDVFAAGTGWQEKLATLTLAKLMKDPGPDALWKDTPYTKATDVNKAVAAGIVHPESWDLSSEGLTITFGQYAVGPYSSGMPSAKIPWRELWPLLAPTLQPTTLPRPLPQPD